MGLQRVRCDLVTEQQRHVKRRCKISPGSLVFVARESARTNIINFTFRLSILLAYSCLLSSLIILFVSVVSVVTYFSFLILLI